MSRPRRAALVTGGSSGIGLAIAHVLAREGHAVTVAARDPERLEAATAALRAAGGETQGVATDIRDPEAVGALASAHTERFGRLDVLVNNAGYGGPVGELDAVDQRQVDRIFAVNLRGTYLVTRACLPPLRAAGGEHGRALIVNTASVGALRGLRGASAYSASKAGVLRMGEALQEEIAGAGVRVTTLCPALTATPMAAAAWQGRVRAEEMLRPEDAGEVVRFLLRTSAACAIPEIALLRPGLTL